MKKILIGLLAFAGLITSAVLIGRSQSAAAFSVGSSSQLGAAAPTPSTEETNQKEQLSKEIQELFLAKEQELLKPGWLHIVYKTSLRKDVDRGFLTDGVPFPNEYIMEDWYLLDEENYAITSVTFMRDLEGNIVQKTIMVDGIMTNTTLGDQMSVEKFKPSLDGGYLSMVASMDTILGKKQENEKNFIVYEIKSNVVDGSVYQVAIQLFFDVQGNFRKSETITIDTDGSEAIDSVTEFLVFENLKEPSKDVMDYYDEVAK